jgi:cold shock protein
MDGNTGRSEGATAEKAVPFPCAVLDPNRSFVELRVGEPRPGARSVSSPPTAVGIARKVSHRGACERCSASRSVFLLRIISARRWCVWQAPARRITRLAGRGAYCALNRINGMPSGRVKFFNTDRGYGFIAPDGGFVHVHDVEAAGMKMLVAGQLVAYEVGPARDGRSKAVNLRLLVG